MDTMTATPSVTLPSPAPDGVLRLAHLGVIRARGDDAAAFLHGQLSQDFALLGVPGARLAAYCSPKGRMLASMIGIKRAADEVLLICHHDVLAATLKRLSMFVLRAKVKLDDASAGFELWGLVGTSALPAGEPWQMLDAPAGVSRVGLYPAAGLTRSLWVAPAGHEAPAGPPLEPATWAWLEVLSGVAMVSAPLVDAFVPQMLNYESVGGVNFKKGCYPGQEVVARSQFRGTLKRRTYLAAADAPMSVGQEVYHPSDADQPTGTIVACSPAPNGGWHALVSMQVSSADGQALHLGQAEGPTLRLLPPPYPLLDDI